MNGGNISQRAALWDGPYEAVHGTAANIHIKLSTSNFKLKKGLVVMRQALFLLPIISVFIIELFEDVLSFYHA